MTLGTPGTDPGVPGAPGTNPGAPGTNPSTPGPGTNPGTPGTNPGPNPGPNPGGTPGTNPGTPGTPGTNPGNPGTNPGTPGTNPGTPGTPGVTVDVTGLQKALEKAAAITQGAKTDGAWEALQNAIRAAQEILDNGPSSQAVVDEGVTALTTAVNVFNASPDKTGGYVVAIADMKAGHMYEVPFAIHK